MRSLLYPYEFKCLYTCSSWADWPMMIFQIIIFEIWWFPSNHGAALSLTFLFFCPSDQQNNDMWNT